MASGWSKRCGLRSNVAILAAMLLAGSALAVGCAGSTVDHDGTAGSPVGGSVQDTDVDQPRPTPTQTRAAGRTADRRVITACGRYGAAADRVESLLSTPDDVPPGAFGTTLVQWADEIDAIAAEAPRSLRVKMNTAAEAVRWIERTLERHRVRTAGLARAVEEWRLASQDTVMACQPYG